MPYLSSGITSYQSTDSGAGVCTRKEHGQLAGPGHQSSLAVPQPVIFDEPPGELHVFQTRLAGVPGTSPPKSHRSNRTTPLPTEATGFLQDLQALQEADRRLIGDPWIDTGLAVVFPTGQSPQPDTFSQRFCCDCEGAGVPLITLHGLRHAHATLVLASGSPIHEVSRNCWPQFCRVHTFGLRPLHACTSSFIDPKGEPCNLQGRRSVTAQRRTVTFSVAPTVLGHRSKNARRPEIVEIPGLLSCRAGEI